MRRLAVILFALAGCAADDTDSTEPATPPDTTTAAHVYDQLAAAGLPVSQPTELDNRTTFLLGDHSEGAIYTDGQWTPPEPIEGAADPITATCGDTTVHLNIPTDDHQHAADWTSQTQQAVNTAGGC
jgi:hypothetical protein